MYGISYMFTGLGDPGLSIANIAFTACDDVQEECGIV
jgi:hypothetical protein